MNEEEIIEIIEKLQCEYKEQENENKYNDYTVYKAKEYSKGLQGLLNLYQKEKLNSFNLSEQLDKEKEKNKELEKITKAVKLLETEKIPDDTYYVIAKTDYLKGDYENILKDYINKDKIKEKIEEFNVPILDVLDKLPIMPRTIERGFGAKDGIIYVLQELLKGE